MTAPVRLADLPPAGRGIVLALLQAERASIAAVLTTRATPEISLPGAAVEVRHDRAASA